MSTFARLTVNGNTMLNFEVSANHIANNNTPEDNTFNFEQTVVNSFDPNDKQVLQGSQISIDEADEYLDT